MSAYLDALTLTKDVVSHAELVGFEFQANTFTTPTHERYPSRGGLSAALTIRTTYRSNPKDLPYADAEGADGYYRYTRRGTDPDAHDNQALRRARTASKPLAWFVGVAPGSFVPIYPVWLVGEEPHQHSFVWRSMP